MYNRHLSESPVSGSVGEGSTQLPFVLTRAAEGLSQPTLRWEGDAGLTSASSKKEYARSRRQCLFEENVKKNGKDVVYEL